MPYNVKKIISNKSIKWSPYRWFSPPVISWSSQRLCPPFVTEGHTCLITPPPIIIHNHPQSVLAGNVVYITTAISSAWKCPKPRLSLPSRAKKHTLLNNFLFWHHIIWHLQLPWQIWPSPSKGVVSRWGPIRPQAGKWGTITMSSTWLPHHNWQ